MIVSIDWDQQNNTLTIVCGSKTVQLVYTNLPPGWEQDPNAYSNFVINYLNNLIKVSVDRGDWLVSKNLKRNDPIPFTDSELIWYDVGSDSVISMDVLVTAAVWSEEKQQYILSIRNTSHHNPRIF